MGKSAVYFNQADGVQLRVSGSGRGYWADDIKWVLGVGGFPIQLTLSKGVRTELPAVPIQRAAKPLWSSLNDEFKVFVTPTRHFKAKFREMFSDLNVAQTSDAESKRWHAEPNMSSRPQQLNVAFWCAMSGCVISRKTLD